MRPPLLPERGIATVVCETKKGAKELVSKADGRTIKGTREMMHFMYVCMLFNFTEEISAASRL